MDEVFKGLTAASLHFFVLFVLFVFFVIFAIAFFKHDV